jgi:signal transduction histidine kinase
LQLLQTDYESDDPVQEQLKKLMEDTERLEHRVKGLQNFSRTLDYSPERLHIGEFCRQQLERWKPRMGRNNIDSHFQIAKDTPEIMGDRRALDQVFTNLITNSLQAMADQDGGVIAIKIKPITEDSQEWVEINVSDTGPGIPDDLRDVVFEPFFTTKKAGEGTGLGLAITRSLIMTQKGEISLQSFPGGTLFRIKLPAAPPDPAKDREAA